MTTSARGLSFDRMIRSMTSTTGAVARTVMRVRGLVRRRGRLNRHLRNAHDRVDRLRELRHVGVRDEEDADDQVVVLRVLLRGVRHDDDRAFGFRTL